jgi:hypothetical protein
MNAEVLTQGTSGPGLLRDTRAARRIAAGVGNRKDRGPRLALISNGGLVIAGQFFGSLRQRLRNGRR